LKEEADMGLMLLLVSMVLSGFVAWRSLAGLKCRGCGRYFGLENLADATTSVTETKHFEKFVRPDQSVEDAPKHYTHSDYDETRAAVLRCSHCGHQFRAETRHRSSSSEVAVFLLVPIKALLLGFAPVWLVLFFRGVSAAMLDTVLPGPMASVLSWILYPLMIAYVGACYVVALRDETNGSWKWTMMAIANLFLMMTAVTVDGSPRLMSAKQRDAIRAIDDIEFLFQQDDQEIPGLVAARVRTLLQRGNSGEAIATAERFAAWAETQEKFHNEKLVDAAGAYALCATFNEVDRSKLVDKAVALLRKAQAAGHFTEPITAKFLQESVFAGIRNEPKLVEFVKELLNPAAPH
jgi:hypothetical protein